MPYLVDAEDRVGAAEMRARIRPEHLAFLESRRSVLLAAGAKLSDDGTTASGSFYIVDTESRAEAEAFIAADPFSLSEVFGTITLRRWRKGYFDFQRQPASGT